GLLRFLYEIEHEAIAVARRNASIANQTDQVDLERRIVHSDHHATIELLAGPVDTRRINQNDLTFGASDDAANLEARRLWLIGNGSDLFADQTIKQRRLARIRPADEGDVAAAKISRAFTH